MNERRPDYAFPLETFGAQPRGPDVPPQHRLRHAAGQAAKFVGVQGLIVIAFSLAVHWFDRTMHGSTMAALMLVAGIATGLAFRDRSALSTFMAWLGFIPVCFVLIVFITMIFNDADVGLDAAIMFASWLICPGSALGYEGVKLFRAYVAR